MKNIVTFLRISFCVGSPVPMKVKKVPSEKSVGAFSFLTGLNTYFLPGRMTYTFDERSKVYLIYSLKILALRYDSQQGTYRFKKVNQRNSVKGTEGINCTVYSM
jgi:hypothetical protein